MDPNVQTQSGATPAGRSIARRARWLRPPFRHRRDEGTPAAPVDQSAMTIAAHLIELRKPFLPSRSSPSCRAASSAFSSPIG